MKRLYTIGLILLLLLCAACGSSRKMRRIRQEELSVSLGLSRGEMEDERKSIRMGTRDTLMVRGDDGSDVIIMKAVRDEQTGEMVAADVIDAAVISARFRNIAERLGQIDIRFDIHVPAALQDSKWQLRLYPLLYIQADTLQLPSVIVTGADYRRDQLEGYRKYERYLASIIRDSTRFVDWRNLNIWIERNLAHKPVFGPDEQEALLHYTRKMLKRYHQKKWEDRGRMFALYVRSPIVTEGVRLDTVLRSDSGEVVYEYIQTIRTRPRLKKVQVVLSGDIYQEDKRLYTMPQTPPLAFYISSLADLADPAERYVKRIVERRVTSHTACELAFRTGRWDIDLGLGDNGGQIGRIRENIRQLEENELFLTDSIVIQAWASPEGSMLANDRLCGRRAASVADYFRGQLADSVRLISRSKGENWPMLGALVLADTLLTPAQKASYMALSGLPQARREMALKKETSYAYIKRVLYPRLRLVTFDFYLSRRGMVKDTIHTTEPDTLYRRALHCLRERDYPTALELLRPYRDINTAITYMAMDRNASALEILLEQPSGPQVNYLLSLVYARRKEEQKAVQCFLDACRQDRALLFRGNLDPEIHVLIERYGLNGDEYTNIL